MLLKRSVLKIFALGITVSPIALVVSCHKAGLVPKIDVDNFDAQKLSTIAVTGDTRNVTFNVPAALTNYDPNTKMLSTNGSEAVLAVYGSANVKINGSDVTGMNKSFMPVELLKEYLAGSLSINNGAVVLTKDGKAASVQSLYGGTFDFNSANLAALNNAPAGEWKTTFNFKYSPLAKVSIETTSLNRTAAANVSSLKTYVALDRAFEKDSTKFSELQTKWTFAPDSVCDSVSWNATNTTADLPSNWSKYVASLTYAAAPMSELKATSSMTRPTSFPAMTTARALTMELKPAEGYVLSFTKYDITALTKIKDLITRVDLLPEYEQADLTKVNLSAADGRLVVESKQVTLPVGTRLEYQLISGGAWLLETELNSAVGAATALTPADFKVRLNVVDTKQLAIRNRKESKPNVSAILGFKDTKSLLTSAQSLVVDLEASDPSKLVWKNPITFSAYAPAVSAINYLVGDYQTEALALSSADWTTLLPNAVSAKWQGFNFWVRPKIESGYLASQLIANYSATARLSEVVPTTEIAAIETELSALRANGVHSSVSWNKTSIAVPAALSSAVASIEYAGGNFTSESQAAGATYTSTLPTTTDFDSTKRHIWVRLTAKNGAKLSKRYIDVTTNSAIATLKSRIDDLPAHGIVDLTKITASGLPTSLAIDAASVTLPIGTKMAYSFKTSGWITEAAMKTYFSTNAASVIASDLSTFKARLEVTDDTKYVLDNSKEATIKTSGVTISLSSLPTEILSTLGLVTVNTASTHDIVTWVNNGSYPASVKQVQFLSGAAYSSKAAATAASESDWKTSLPGVLDFAHNSRYLWARVTPNAPYVFADNIVDLTSTSKIRDIKSKIDVLAQHNALNLAAITISGSPLALTVNDSSAVLPTGAKITYSINGTTWLEKAAFINAVATMTDVVKSQIAAIQARLEPTSTSLYVLIDDKKARPSTTAVSLGLDALPSEVTTFLIARQANLTTSTHSNVVYTAASALTLPSEIASIKYLINENTSAALPSALDLIPDANWSDTLPTSVDYVHGKRHLWAKAIKAPGYKITNPYLDMTASSKIQEVKSKVDLHPSYDAVNLSLIKLTGSASTITVDESAVVLPLGAELEYSLNGTAWISKTDLIASAVVTNLTETTKAQIVVRLKPVSALYVVVNNKQVSPNVSGISTVPFPVAVSSYLGSITPEAISVNDATTWQVGPAYSSFQLPATVSKIQFLSGNYSTIEEAKAATGWAGTGTGLDGLPKTVDYTHAQRHLWARIVPIVPGTFVNEYLEITSSSKIQTIKTKVETHPSYSAFLQKFDTTAFFIEGALYNDKDGPYTVQHRYDAKLFPTGAKVVFSFGTNYVGEKSSTELTAWLQSNASSFKLSDFTSSLKAKLVTSDANLFIVNTTNEITFAGESFGPIGYLNPGDFRTLLTPVTVGSGSTINSIRWLSGSNLNVPKLLGGRIKSITYKLTSATTAVDAIAASGQFTSLPSSTTLANASRNLWARIELQDGWFIDPATFEVGSTTSVIYINITSSSSIRLVSA